MDESIFFDLVNIAILELVRNTLEGEQPYPLLLKQKLLYALPNHQSSEIIILAT